MDAYKPVVERMMKRLFDSLGENDRRRYAAVEAAKLGHGGIGYIAQILQCDPKRRAKMAIAHFLTVHTPVSRSPPAPVRTTPMIHSLPKVRPVLAMIAHSRALVKGDDRPDPASTSRTGFLPFSPTSHPAPLPP